MEYGALLAQIAAKPVGRGWDAPCPMVARHRRGDRSPSCRLWVGDRGELVARCLGCQATWPELMKAWRTDARDWWPANGKLPARKWTVGQVTGRYDYFDENGVYLAQKVRREPGPYGEPKHFSWRRPLPLDKREALGIKPGSNAWVYGLDEGWYEPHGNELRDWRQTKQPTGRAIQMPKTAIGLYRLPQMLGTAFDRPIFYVEGERKADLLCSLKFMAVSGPGGAGKWNAAWAEYFRDRKVIIFPDNNAPGLQHAAIVCGTLLLHGVAGVKVIVPGEQWPVAVNDDVGDWLLKLSALSRRQAVCDLLGKHASYMAVAAKAGA